MNKCPACRSENVVFFDSSNTITYEPPSSKDEYLQWIQYDCQDCGALLEVEDGYISVKREVNFEYKTVMRFTVNWEKVLNEL